MKSLLPLITVFSTIIYSMETSASGAPEDCVDIADDRSRLACFDTAFRTSDRKENTAVVQPVVASSALDTRLAGELSSEDRPFSITPHRPNYLMPFTYNASADYSVYPVLSDALSRTEVKLQLSLKTMLAHGLWRDSSLWAAYTQQSYWQIYADDEASAPFRETNHEPELRWQIPVQFNVLGWDARLASLSLNHQSNGQIDPVSRSWNRVVGELVMERGRWVGRMGTWLRIDDDSDDDNPDIEDYMGRMHVALAYRGRNHLLGVALKNNLDFEDNRSGVELNWTFPLTDRLRGFVQIYSGYGENLLEMENYNNRVGLGIALTDWL